MIPPEKSVLSLSRVRFYSTGDEDAFFHWLNRIKCISHHEGLGAELLLHVDSRAVDEASLRDLIAFFWRYEVPMEQLAIFDRTAHSSWLRNQKSFWFASMFGTTPH
ncbi:hypothetical protein [Stenotrophomonas terrae]|uniref:hypothetical protein n=1 Tax=Stenotrophomonas terrae TaxID=405446 RepID=UPI00128E9FEC|nr:hypothetical protein [Stenotrophomonas terrae]